MARYKTAPKTEEIYLLLKQKICGGVYSREGRLPTETVLSEELAVSRKTLRAALARLAVESLVERVKGQGTFIKTNSQRHKILVIVGNIEDITNSGRYILPGIQAEAETLGFDVETCTEYSLSLMTPEDFKHHLKEKNYRGIISFSVNFNGDEPILKTLQNCGLPVLFPHGLPRDAETTKLSVSGIDYPALVRDGLLYLASLGHKRIVFLTYQTQRISREDYFALLGEIGLDTCPALRHELESPNDKKIIDAGIAAYFESLRKKPTAVLCFSDFYAIELYQYLHKNGIRIPEDISVLSIGGQIGCDFLNPPLSALDFNCLEIGRSAVRRLLEIDTETLQPLPFAVTPHRLMERASTRKRS